MELTLLRYPHGKCLRADVSRTCFVDFPFAHAQHGGGLCADYRSTNLSFRR